MNNNKSYTVCFGEVLWDIFPAGSRAGGAPFNVAYNLDKMGVEVQMISKIGKDKLGNELLNQIKSWDISTDYIQIDEENQQELSLRISTNTVKRIMISLRM